jgi:hypothetical protein
MPLIDYADHRWAAHCRPAEWNSRRDLLFWWEITKDMPPRCPDCEAVMSPDGYCPSVAELEAEGLPFRVSDERLRCNGPNWPVKAF